MPEFLQERTDLWQYLAGSTKPIVLYGMGNGADKIMAVLAHYNIKLKAVFASDEFVRGHSFKGYHVLKYSDVCRKYTNFIVLVAFGTEKEDVISKIVNISKEQELYVPDVPVVGGGLWNFEYYKTHENEIKRVYDVFEDDISRKVFEDILNYKLSGKIKYLQSSASPLVHAYKQILNLGNKETFLDLGAYTGDTVEEFIEFMDGYKKIIALEPDYKNFIKLQKRVMDNKYENVECYNLGAWHEKDSLFCSALAGRNSSLNSKKGKKIAVESVDDLLQGEPVTYIKMDVEGAEKNALIGAKSTINKFKPKLLVSAYHRNEDIFQLPWLIKELNPNYHIYLRRHPAIPAWNINIYAV